MAQPCNRKRKRGDALPSVDSRTLSDKVVEQLQTAGRITVQQLADQIGADVHAVQEVLEVLEALAVASRAGVIRNGIPLLMDHSSAKPVNRAGSRRSAAPATGAEQSAHASLAEPAVDSATAVLWQFLDGRQFTMPVPLARLGEEMRAARGDLASVGRRVRALHGALRSRRRPTPDSVARLAHRLTAGRRGVAEDPLYAALRSVLPELSLDALGEPLGKPTTARGAGGKLAGPARGGMAAHQRGAKRAARGGRRGPTVAGFPLLSPASPLSEPSAAGEGESELDSSNTTEQAGGAQQGGADGEEGALGARAASASGRGPATATAATPQANAAAAMAMVAPQAAQAAVLSGDPRLYWAALAPALQSAHALPGSASHGSSYSAAALGGRPRSASHTSQPAPTPAARDSGVPQSMAMAAAAASLQHSAATIAALHKLHWPPLPTATAGAAAALGTSLMHPSAPVVAPAPAPSPLGRGHLAQL